MIVDQIYNIAREENLSVFGIGPAAEMANDSPGTRPEDFLPGTKSLICFGIAMPRGVYQSPTYNLEMVWRSQNLLYRQLDMISLRFSTLLEENGFRAIPIYGCMPLGVNDEGTVIGFVNQLRMAEIAKIGVIGKNGLLLHSRYGSRLMLGGLLTTAPLPAMHDSDQEEPGCPPNCQICSDACPVHAIMPEKKQVKIMRCLAYTSRTPLMSRLKFLLLRAFDKKAAARYMSLTGVDEHTFHICSKCVALCPYGEAG